MLDLDLHIVYLINLICSICPLWYPLILRVGVVDKRALGFGTSHCVSSMRRDSIRNESRLWEHHHYIISHCITLHYIMLHIITLEMAVDYESIAIKWFYICIALHFIALHYITLHWVTLHYKWQKIMRALPLPADCGAAPFPPK